VRPEGEDVGGRELFAQLADVPGGIACRQVHHDQVGRVAAAALQQLRAGGLPARLDAHAAHEVIRPEKYLHV
jgi:hypothetical protein